MLSMIIINGITLGGMFALLAMGFSLVFGVARILNMTHTAFYMITCFLIFSGTDYLKLSLLPAAMMAIPVTVVIGMLSYKFIFDRIKEHETAVMIVSLAFAIVLQEIILLIFGGHFRSVPPFASGFIEFGGSRVTYQHFFVVGVVGLVIVGVFLLLSRTRLGNAIKAVAQDREIANLMGIDVSRMCMIVTGISAGLAAMASAILAPIYMSEPLMWLHSLVMVLAVVVLGGLGSVKGSVIAAFILGFAENTVIFLIPEGSFLRGAVSLAAMVVVILARPEGLFGVVFEEERL
ncbi:MAG: branched-chain amino acid ABC transporter permease [Desulfatiglans sp.]|jgi:branched-chain amino acid transport system permease protein|nr:branched-chain amino acid ABC transporter permease [Thermodesulfobacteriota bacterium]MEE4352850.1 branched-chain amino acid ABC transporter permease [Desulfatiglans sp.]